MGDNAEPDNIGLGGLPFIFPDASVIDSRYFVYDLLNRSDSPMWDGTRVLLPPSFSWGNRVSNTNPNYAPPNIGFPSQNVASTMDVVGQPDQGLGPPHASRPASTTSTATSSRCRGARRAGRPELPAGQRRHQSVRHLVRILERRDRVLQLVLAGVKGVEGEYIYYNTEGYVQDNWRVNRA